MSFRVLARVGVVVILVVILAAALVSFVFLSRGKRTVPAVEESHPAPVKVVPATMAYFGEWTELLGTTQPLPNCVARISAAVEGRVLSILGDGKGPSLAEGDRVEENQVIVQLDDSVPRAYRDKLAVVLIDLELQYKQAQFALERAEMEVKRLEEMNQGRSGSPGPPALPSADLEKARQARVDAQSRQATTAAWQAVVQAELKALDAYLRQFSMRTPIAGQLGLIQVTPGQAIAPGTTVADVVNLQEINVLCYVPPHAVARLALGQPARLDPRQQPTGEVVFIAVQAEPDTGNFAVKVRFQNTDAKLRANSVQRIQVLTEPEKARLTIPEDALLEDQASPVVMAAAEIKTALAPDKRTKVKLGKALKLRPILGVRDRDQQLVEILRLYDAEKGSRVSIRDIRFIIGGAQGLHGDDQLLVTGNLVLRDDVLNLEETAPKTLKERTTLGGQGAIVSSVAFSPDGKTLASGSIDGSIKVWDVATGKNSATYEKHLGGVFSLAFSKDGKTLAAGSPLGTIKLWDVGTGKNTAVIQGHAKDVSSLTFSPGGKTFASGGFDGTVKLWDVADGKNVAVFTPHKRQITAIVFSPDGKLLATASADKTIKVLDLDSGKNILTLEGHTGVVSAVAFSPDGKTLVSSSKTVGKDRSTTGKGEIRLWDVASGKNISTVEGDSRAPRGTFSPDGKTLAWGGENTIALWDVASGKEIASLVGHTGNVIALGFSADGKTLASGGIDTTVKLWDVPAAK